MSTSHEPLPADGVPENKHNPFEAARFVCAFAECDREMQNIVLEMASIIADEESTNDERTVAFDAMMQALFPGTATDLLALYRDGMKSPEAAQAAADLKSEERGFTERVRRLMVDKNITQEQLAQEIGIGQPAVSNILNRRCRPQRRTVVRFAEALKVRPEELWPNIGSVDD